MDGQVGQWQVPLSLEKGMSHFPNGQSMAMLDMCVFVDIVASRVVSHTRPNQYQGE